MENRNFVPVFSYCGCRSYTVFTTNNFETTMFNVFFLIQAIFSGIAVLAGIISIITKRIRIRKPSIAILLVAAIPIMWSIRRMDWKYGKSEEIVTHAAGSLFGQCQNSMTHRCVINREL